MESIRDWGRDCWCEPGVDNTCGKRFDRQLGDLPYGYDHKYTDDWGINRIFVIFRSLTSADVEAVKMDKFDF